MRLFYVLVFMAIVESKRGQKGPKKEAKKLKKEAKKQKSEEEERAKFNGDHYCNITDYLHLSSSKAKDCSVNNENCGPDAVCPNEKCQFHCKKATKSESFSMNCRCKKDKSGEIQCHLKTQPRLKLKSLIRKECDGREPLEDWVPLIPMDKPIKPGKPSKPDAKPDAKPDGKPDVGKPTKPTKPIKPTKPVKPNKPTNKPNSYNYIAAAAGQTCEDTVDTYSASMKRPLKTLVDISSCSNSTHPGSECSSECSQFYEDSPGQTSMVCACGPAKSKKDKKAGKLLCDWKFETRKPNYLKSCSPLYCAESDLPTIQNAQLECELTTDATGNSFITNFRYCKYVCNPGYNFKEGSWDSNLYKIDAGTFCKQGTFDIFENMNFNEDDLPECAKESSISHKN